MARNVPDSGEYIFIDELTTAESDVCGKDIKSVRVSGRNNILVACQERTIYENNVFELRNREFNCKLCEEKLTYTVLDHHDACLCRAKLTDPRKGCSIYVDTRLVEPFDGRKGSLFQIIGELDCMENEDAGILLRARVMRCVDGIDLILFRQSILAQRQYFNSR